MWKSALEKRPLSLLTFQGSPDFCGVAAQNPAAESVCTGCGAETCSRDEFTVVEGAQWTGVVLYKHNNLMEYVTVVERSSAIVTGIVHREDVDHLWVDTPHEPDYFLEHAASVCPADAPPRIVRNGIFFAEAFGVPLSRQIQLDGGSIRPSPLRKARKSSNQAARRPTGCSSRPPDGGAPG